MTKDLRKQFLLWLASHAFVVRRATKVQARSNQESDDISTSLNS